MKKMDYLKVVLLAILVLVGALAVYLNTKEEKYTADEIKFKEEYESLNGKKTTSGKEYLNVEILKDNNIQYKTLKEINEIIDGTGVIYFGFPECPWCRNAIPLILEAAKEVGISEIYYCNAKDERNELYLDENGNIITKKEGSEDYNTLLLKLKDTLSVYGGLNDENLKRLYFPTLLVVKDGEVLAFHEGTLDTQLDPYQGLSAEDKEKLQDIFVNKINKIATDMCDDKC